MHQQREVKQPKQEAVREEGTLIRAAADQVQSAKQRGVWKRTWEREHSVPRLVWKTAALCEGPCVSGRKRAGMDGGGAGEVNRGQILRARGETCILSQRTMEPWKVVHSKICVFIFIISFNIYFY